MTGGRFKRVLITCAMKHLFTYGDGLADVDITALIAHHKARGRQGTVTAVQRQADTAPCSS